MTIVLIKDLQASDLGYPDGGLLHMAGARLDNCLPAVEKKLLAEGFAITEEQWKQQAGKAKQPLKNKRRRPYAVEDKSK